MDSLQVIDLFVNNCRAIFLSEQCPLADKKAYAGYTLHTASNLVFSFRRLGAESVVVNVGLHFIDLFSGSREVVCKCQDYHASKETQTEVTFVHDVFEVT